MCVCACVYSSSCRFLAWVGIGLGEQVLNIALLTERNALYKQDPLAETWGQGKNERGERD